MKLRKLNGFILARNDGKPASARMMQELPGVTHIGHLFGTGWEHYELTSTTPLLDDADGDSPFKYPLVVRRSEERLVLLSRQRRLIELILSSPAYNLQQHVFHLGIRVDALVDYLIETQKELPEKALIPSYLYARTPSSGERMRGVALYGDDVTNTNLFLDHRSQMDILTCGLRRRFSEEIAQVSTNGNVSFKLPDTNEERVDRLRAVEEILLYVRTKGFLQTPKGEVA